MAQRDAPQMQRCTLGGKTGQPSRNKAIQRDSCTQPASFCGGGPEVREAVDPALQTWRCGEDEAVPSVCANAVLLVIPHPGLERPRSSEVSVNAPDL